MLLSSPQTYEATKERLGSSMTGRLYMHVPLRVAWKRPRAVENMAISAHRRSLKALTFIIYMRVVAFACSLSHTAASRISEPPVCEDKAHIWHLYPYPTFAWCLESCKVLKNYRDNSSQNIFFSPCIYSYLSICAFMHVCMSFVLLYWFFSMQMIISFLCK